MEKGAFIYDKHATAREIREITARIKFNHENVTILGSSIMYFTMGDYANDSFRLANLILYYDEQWSLDE